MKKSIVILLALLFSCSVFATEWTLMFYLNGDNNLDPYIKTTLNRLARSTANKDVNVLIMVDTADEGDSRLYAYRGDDLVNIEKNVEYNMGDARTLGKLIKTAKKSFPAKRYALTIYTHGRGILNLPVADGTQFNDDDQIQNLVMSPDDESSSILYEEEMVDELLPILKGEKLDLLVFNSCLIGNTGIYLTLAPLAKYMVASEFLIGLDRNSGSVEATRGIGIDLRAMVDSLKSDPTQSTEMVGKGIVDRFQKGYSNGFFNPSNFDKPRLIPSTLALYDFSGVKRLKELLFDLSTQFMRKASQGPHYMDQLYHELLRFQMVGGVGYFDLGSLAKAISRSMNLPAANSIVHLLYDSKKVVNYSRSAHVKYQNSGLSIFFPITTLRETEEKDFLNFYKNLKYEAEILWTRVLKRFSKDLPIRKYEIRLRLLKLYLAGENVVVLPGQRTPAENEYELLHFLLWDRFYNDLQARDFDHLFEWVNLLMESNISSFEFIAYKHSLISLLNKAIDEDFDPRLKSLLKRLEDSLENI